MTYIKQIQIKFIRVFWVNYGHSVTAIIVLFSILLFYFRAAPSAK